MKKLLLILMVILLLLTTSALAEEIEESIVYYSGDWTYILLADGTAEVAGYMGWEKELTVPAEIDGHAVASIGDNAFFKCRTLSSITLLDSVTNIGDYAFSNCESLRSISLPDSVTCIGTNPFASCPQLTDFLVSPDHPMLETIDGVLFDKMEKRLICYPYAFKASSYTVPQGILSIGDEAFAYNESLISVILPDSVTSIGVNPFTYCKKLTDIIVSQENPTLEVVDGVLFEKNEKRLVCYPCAFTDRNYAVPQGICSIGGSAFYGCRSLRRIDLADSVTSIGDYAFYLCGSLSSIAMLDSVTSIGDYAFYYCRSLRSLTLSDSLTSIGNSAFCSCQSLASLTLPDSVTSIGDSAFSSCPSLTLTIPHDTWLTNWCEANNLRYTFAD